MRPGLQGRGSQRFGLCVRGSCVRLRLPEPSLSRHVSRVSRGKRRGRRIDEAADLGAERVNQSLELFPIGNCAASALIDDQGRHVWACAPRVDGDPFFSALLGGNGLDDEDAQGFWGIEVIERAKTEQAYERNTPILRTEITDAAGARLEIIDFCPRYRQFGRLYRPLAFIRLIRPLEGTPRIRIKLRPTINYGAAPAQITRGSNHLRYVGGETTLRLTTNGPVSHVAEERVFRLE